MIRADNLYKSFKGKELLAAVSCSFPDKEKIALVGDNGAGKSTLLRILTGEELPDEGSVVVPSKIRLGFLPQEPNASPQDTVLSECEAGVAEIQTLQLRMQELLKRMEGQLHPDEQLLRAYEDAESSFRAGGGYSLSSRAASILSGLGFSEDQLKQNPRDLSGGWRMRLELARLFLKQPDLLILDEPTNHLDLPSLVWVENWLQGFGGTLLFVSHDRAFLNRLSTTTMHLHQGSLTLYKGNYDSFLSTRALRDAQDASRRKQLESRKEELEQFVKRFGAKATKAKQAKSKLKQIDRLDEESQACSFGGKEASPVFSLPAPQRIGRILCQIENGSIGYDKPLSEGICLQVEKGQKIAVIGANGIGKSTLIRTLSGHISPLGGNFCLSDQLVIAYFAQNQADMLDQNLSILENVFSHSEMGVKEIRSLLGGLLFSGDDVDKPVKVLSGGEKSRVGLACTLAKSANLLLLDEPTNHLDMKSLDRLSLALKNYEGTLIFVSHDRDLINRVCTHVFAMIPDGRSMLFEGNLDDYTRLSALAGFPNVLAAQNYENQSSEEKSVVAMAEADEASYHRMTDSEFREIRKKNQKLNKEAHQIEEDLMLCRKNLDGVERQMLDCGGDFKLLAELQGTQRDLHRQISNAEDRWLSIQEEIENIEKDMHLAGRQI